MNEPCGECGLDNSAIGGDEVAPRIRDLARKWQAPLSRFLPGEVGDTLVRARPDEGAWSALEYAAHVRDGIAGLSFALSITQQVDDPEFPWPDVNQSAIDGRYNELDPAEVAAEIAENGERAAVIAEAVGPRGWSRTAQRKGEMIDALWLGRHIVHEAHHHLLDVGRVLRHAREAAR